MQSNVEVGVQAEPGFGPDINAGTGAGPSPSKEWSEVKDPIHNYIPLSPRLLKFIDTKQFQRLRSIKQLGTSYFVWPGASHNRFEHCLGVAYLARLLAEHLQKSQPELRISDRDVECVEIAGLCHDLGHGPWSHVFDGIFMPRALKGGTWQHEEGSNMMFDYLVRDNGITICEEDVCFIKALIMGDRTMCSPDEKLFLFDIVANKRNGFDVDKFDYIQRDTHMIGEPISISARRIIKSSRVLDNQICYNIKDANALYEICATRFKLHKLIYNHRTAKSIEYMVVDGLLAADPYLHIADHVNNPKRFVHLSDDIMPLIEASESEELAPARAIFTRIRKRDLYRRVDFKVIDYPFKGIFEQYMTPERILEAAKKVASSTAVGATPTPAPSDTTSEGGDDESLAPTEVTDEERGEEELRAEHIIIDFSTMHYGMKEHNPVDKVKFYSKHHPNQCAPASRGDYSTLQPAMFAEVLLTVFTKLPAYVGFVQAGYREVLQDMSVRFASTLSPASSTSGATGVNTSPTEREQDMEMETRMTPPITEPPTTPKVSSTRSASKGSAGAGWAFGVRGGSFSNNSFTTIAPGYAPVSPLGSGFEAGKGRRKGKGVKRKREEGEGEKGKGERKGREEREEGGRKKNKV